MATVQQLCDCKNRIRLNSMPWFCGRCGRPFEPAAPPSAVRITEHEDGGQLGSHSTHREPVDKFSGLPSAVPPGAVCCHCNAAIEFGGGIWYSNDVGGSQRMWCGNGETPHQPKAAEPGVEPELIATMVYNREKQTITRIPASASAREAQACAEELSKFCAENETIIPTWRHFLPILSRHFPAPESAEPAPGYLNKCIEAADCDCIDICKFRGAPAAQITGEQFLARRGFADSRNYSSTELGPLLEEYVRGCAPAEPQRWRGVKAELPEEGSEVFAAVWWTTEETSHSSYEVHDCCFWKQGEEWGPKDIFVDCDGTEFDAEEESFWIYRKDLVAHLPAPKERP